MQVKVVRARKRLLETETESSDEGELMSASGFIYILCVIPLFIFSHDHKCFFLSFLLHLISKNSHYFN